MIPGHQRRHLVQVHFLERNALLALGQVGGAGVQPLRDLLHGQVEQHLRIAVQVEHDHPVADVRVGRQRQHRRRAQAAGGVAHRDVQRRLHRHHVQQAGGEALVAQLQRVVPHARLRLPERAGHADGGVHVGQRLMRIALAHAVGQRQVLELERGGAILAPWPVDALRAQRVHQPQHVQQVPARIAAAPLALVRIEEVAEQAVADEFVVETQRVVAQRAGLRTRHQFVDARERLGFAQALGQRVLRGDAGDQGGDGRGQQVVGRPDEEAHRLLHHLQLRIGAHRRELRDAGAARVLAEGLEVVEQEGVGHGRLPWPRCRCDGALADACHQCAPSRTGSWAKMVRSSAGQSMPARLAWPAVASARIRCCSRVRSSASAYGVCRKVTMA